MIYGDLRFDMSEKKAPEVTRRLHFLGVFQCFFPYLPNPLSLEVRRAGNFMPPPPVSRGWS